MKFNCIIKITTILIFGFLACGDDSASVDGSGVLSVTVQTSSDIWGYPMVGTSSFVGDTTKTWLYPLVGGDEFKDDLIDGINDDGPGDRINIVYLYDALGESSRTYPVLYRGESLDNNSAIVISGIAPGEYYVVAFYDYCGGGNRENLLNRYDRYAAYVESGNALGGSANSSPYIDHAVPVTVNDGVTTEITLEIMRDWVLGKPNTGSGGTGRLFLTSSDPIPTP